MISAKVLADLKNGDILESCCLLMSLLPIQSTSHMSRVFTHTPTSDRLEVGVRFSPGIVRHSWEIEWLKIDVEMRPPSFFSLLTMYRAQDD